MRHDSIEAGNDALVLLQINRLVRLDPFVALAIAIGVENERGPALRLLNVTCLQEHTRLEPAQHLAAARTPNRIILVIAKVQMMRLEACLIGRVGFGLGIIHGDATRRCIEREDFS